MPPPQDEEQAVQGVLSHLGKQRGIRNYYPCCSHLPTPTCTPKMHKQLSARLFVCLGFSVQLCLFVCLFCFCVFCFVLFFCLVWCVLICFFYLGNISKNQSCIFVGVHSSKACSWLMSLMSQLTI